MTVVVAILTALIALIAAGIALGQLWVARNKFKFDLFDHRVEIYDAVRAIRSEIFHNTTISAEAHQTYLEGIRGAKWLFNDEIDQYLWFALHGRIVRIQAINHELEPNTPHERRLQLAAEIGDIMRWSNAQGPIVDAMFEPFLRIDQNFSVWLTSGSFWQTARTKLGTMTTLIRDKWPLTRR